MHDIIVCVASNKDVAFEFESEGDTPNYVYQGLVSMTDQSRRLPSQAGFTLIELVMVIVLIGILSALGIGLFANRAAFSPLLAQQQLASAVLLTQQAALAGNSAHTLSISQTADAFVFTLNSGRSFSLDRNDTTLSATPTLTFNQDGSVVSGVTTQLTFTGADTSYSTCISSLGAVFAGSCP